MNEYCQNTFTCNQCDTSSGLECDKYKEKADELYLKATCMHEEAKRFLCEAKELDNIAKDFEKRAKEACAEAHMVWEHAHKLDVEADNLLDLASFYSKKASDCAKNESRAYSFKPNCNINSCSNNCNSSCKY